MYNKPVSTIYAEGKVSNEGYYKPATLARRERIEKFLVDAGYTMAILLDEERGFATPGLSVFSDDDGLTTVCYKAPRKDVGKLKETARQMLEDCFATLNNAPRYKAVFHPNGCTILDGHVEVYEK